MKSRVLTGIILLGSLLLSLLLLRTFWYNLIIAFLIGAAVFEIFGSINATKSKLLLGLCLSFALIAPFLNIGTTLLEFLPPFYRLIFGGFPLVETFFVFTVIFLCALLTLHRRVDIAKAGLVYMLTVAISLSLSCLVYVRNLAFADGVYFFYVALIFAGSWWTDVGAYLMGRLFGKHKLSPLISPNKTIEGAIGGIVFCVGLFVAFGIVYDKYFLLDATANLWLLALLAIPCAIAAMLGDLFFSMVKRSCQIKDFGSIMPGHGGFCDRFDSMIFVAPLIFFVGKYLTSFIIVR